MEGLRRLSEVPVGIAPLPVGCGCRDGSMPTTSLSRALEGDQSLAQVGNVAHLPGIIRCSLAMPDIHFGYGFPIGGVAAFRVDDGVVSPGGVGYDINCGCRLLATDLQASDIKDKVRPLVDQLFRDVPVGGGFEAEPSPACPASDLEKLLVRGAGWAVEQGYGSKADLDHTEDGGALAGADPGAVSERAYTRGQDQVGTLGSGNHFLELQTVDAVFDREAAAAFGLFEGQVTLMVHCGSRGFGYQVCDDYLAVMEEASQALRHPTARPAAGLRAGRLAGGPALPGGHGLRRQLCLGQPADDHAPGREGHLARSAHLPARAEPAPGLRRGPQHRQAGDPRGRRGRGRDLRAPQRGHPGVRTRPRGGAARTTARSGSPSSSPATWARPRSSAGAPTRP